MFQTQIRSRVLKNPMKNSRENMFYKKHEISHLTYSIGCFGSLICERHWFLATLTLNDEVLRWS